MRRRFAARPVELHVLAHDELDAAWQWLDPIQQAWARDNQPLRPYPAGTWGPTASSALVARDGDSWREES